MDKYSQDQMMFNPDYSSTSAENYIGLKGATDIFLGASAVQLASDSMKYIKRYSRTPRHLDTAPNTILVDTIDGVLGTLIDSPKTA